MSTCRSCGAEIRWVVTTKGKLMPVDNEPHPEGNVVPTGRRGKTRAGDAPEVRVLPGGQIPLDGVAPPGSPLFMPHFATCPDAGAWRA